MKSLIKIYFVFIFSLGLMQNSFAQSESIKSFAANLQSGNTKELLKILNDNVEINMNGNRQFISKAESESILKNFVAQHPATKFEFEKTGASGSTNFAIGKYISNADTYRIMVKVNGTLIEKIELTKE